MRKLCVCAMHVICKCNATLITPHSHYAGRKNLAKHVVLNVVRLQ